jgi:adenylate kinase family enzyme
VQIIPITALGKRIMILGQTNSGKSTLAHALGVKLNIPVTHLDQLRHLPYTDWQERPDAEFKALHDTVDANETWIIDGGYSKLSPPRIARATSIIVPTDHLLRRYQRYFPRTLFERNRIGKLEGGRDVINWKMLHWLWHTRDSHLKYQKIAIASGLPIIFISTESELNAIYAAWNLKCP